MAYKSQWSRPTKSQATPAPYYLLPGGEATAYCRSCGRVISSRKATASIKGSPNKKNKAAKHGDEEEEQAELTNTSKYCSARCRSHKPGKLDRELEDAFIRFLTGELDLPQDDEGGKHGRPKTSTPKRVKGDGRILVRCSVVEDYIFGHDEEGQQEGERDSQSGSGTEDQVSEREGGEQQVRHAEKKSIETKTDYAPRAALPQEDEITAEKLASLSVRSGTRVRPAQAVSLVNGSIGGEKGRAERIEETKVMEEKRHQGQRRAERKERTKCAARRGVVFGFRIRGSDGGEEGDGDGRRLCEAVMNGKVVEPSFAKGDWAIRWRE